MLAQFGKLDDLGGDDFGGRIGGVGKPKQPAGILERDAHGPRDLGLEGMVLEERSDRQSAAPDGPTRPIVHRPMTNCDSNLAARSSRSGIEPQTGHKRLTNSDDQSPLGARCEDNLNDR